MSRNYTPADVLVYSRRNMVREKWGEGTLKHEDLLALASLIRRDIRHASNVIIAWTVATAIVMMTAFALIVKYG